MSKRRAAATLAVTALLTACGEQPVRQVDLCSDRLAQRQTVEVTLYWQGDGFGADRLYDPRCPNAGTLALLELEPKAVAPLLADHFERFRPGADIPQSKLTLRGEYVPRTLERSALFHARELLAAEPVEPSI